MRSVTIRVSGLVLAVCLAAVPSVAEETFTCMREGRLAGPPTTSCGTDVSVLGWYHVTFGPWTAEATGDVAFRITIGDDTYLSGVCHVLVGRKDPTQPFCSFDATGALQAGPGAEFWYEVTDAPATFEFWVESPSCAETSLCSVPVAIAAGSFTFTMTKVDGPRSDP